MIVDEPGGPPLPLQATNVAEGGCALVQTQLLVLQSFTVVVDQPADCFASSTCGQLTFSGTADCDHNYVAAAASVQSSTSAAFVSPDEAWCAQAVAARVAGSWQPPAVVLRSSSDPFFLAQQSTGCNLWFGLAADKTKVLGFPLFVSGVATSAFAWGAFSLLICRFYYGRDLVQTIDERDRV